MTDTNDRVSDEVAQRIDAMAGGLPKSVAPPDTMWTGIEGRIDTGSGRSGWVAGWTQAAAAVVLIGVTATITTLVLQEPRPVTDESAAAADAVEVASPDGQQEAPVGSDNGESAVYWPRGLSGGIGSAEYMAVNTLPDDMRRTYLDNLVEVQSARKTIESALEEDPTNMWLRELWLHTYEQEMELLDDSNRVAHEVSGRLTT